MSKTWRQLIPFLGPRWLTKDRYTAQDGSTVETDSRVLYATQLLFDTMSERIRAGIAARIVGLAPDDALTYIGQDRQVIRGPAESRASYIERLRTSLDDWRIAGSAWSLLSQIRGYCSPNLVRVRVVNNRGNFYTIDRDGTRSTARATAWNWDGQTSAWSRFWVMIYPTTGAPQMPWARASVWGAGGSKWGVPAGATWGSTATVADVAAIRSIVQTWKPIASRCVSVMVVFVDASTAFNPASAAPPLPDGTWGTFGKYATPSSTIKIPARSADAIYWSGT